MKFEKQIVDYVLNTKFEDIPRGAIETTKRMLLAPRAAHPEADLAEQAVLFESPEKERRMTAFLERRSRSTEADAERRSRSTEPDAERRSKREQA